MLRRLPLVPLLLLSGSLSACLLTLEETHRATRPRIDGGSSDASVTNDGASVSDGSPEVLSNEDARSERPSEFDTSVEETSTDAPIFNESSSEDQAVFLDATDVTPPDHITITDVVRPDALVDDTIAILPDRPEPPDVLRIDVLRTCNSNAECTSPSEYCGASIGQCAGSGVCTPRSPACMAIFAPVCGCDGRTYENECAANSAGVRVAANGMCIVVPPPDVPVRMDVPPDRPSDVFLPPDVVGPDITSTSDTIVPPLCGPGQTACGGVCRTLGSDPNNCGMCGRVCEPSQLCAGGVCQSCPVGQVRCADPNRCINLQTDPANCGMCGRTCSSGTACVAGLCTGTLMCAVGQTPCGPVGMQTCVNTQVDPNNCGSCGSVCGAPSGFRGVCSNGGCVVRCPANTFNCDGATANGCEASPSVGTCVTCSSVCPSMGAGLCGLGAGFGCCFETPQTLCGAGTCSGFPGTTCTVLGGRARCCAPPVMTN